MDRDFCNQHQMGFSIINVIPVKVAFYITFYFNFLEILLKFIFIQRSSNIQQVMLS